MLPYLNDHTKYEQRGYAFQGYNRNPYGHAGTFCEMENMTGEDAPLIRTRKKRHLVRTLENPGGLFGHDHLGWVDGTALYYNGVQVGTVTAGEKQIVAMGARYVIFPDKVMYNTADGTLTSLENTVSISGTVTYTSCDLDGEPLEAGSAVYVKLAAAGIGSGFNENDVVTITGSEYIPDGAYQIYTVRNDSLIVLATVSEDTQTGTGLSLARSCPDMDYVTECDNRLWGCSSANHEVYACKLGDPTNWTNYQGLANDAYAVTIGSEGDFTGAATHLGYVLFFKEDRILKLYGNRPSNYQLAESRVRGVAAGSAKSLTVLNETLYYMSPEGMMAYEGSLPASVHGAFWNAEYHDAVGGAGYGTIYMSMLDSEDQPHVFTFRDGLWHREDGARFTAIQKAGSALYAVADDGKLWRLRGGATEMDGEDAADEEELSWYLETGDLDMMDLKKKHLQKLQLRYTLGEGASCTVKVQYDGGSYITHKMTTNKAGKKAQRVAIIPRRCDHMRIRLEGTGMMKLGNLYYFIEEGSDL